MILPGETTLLVLDTTESARTRLPGHDEDDILHLIESGGIAFAWDISAADSDSDRHIREIRIYPPCVEHYLQCGGHRPFPRFDHQVITHLVNIVAEGKPFTTAEKFSLLLNCGTELIYRLIAQNRVRVLPNTTWRRGRGGSALLDAHSLKKFFGDARVI
jgi:hypothetical protein